MTGKAWYDKCRASYEAEATIQVEAGLKRVDLNNAIFPAIFIDGDSAFYLARTMGSAEWRLKRLFLGDWPGWVEKFADPST
jgi:hypothetical protein